MNDKRNGGQRMKKSTTEQLGSTWFAAIFLVFGVASLPMHAAAQERTESGALEPAETQRDAVFDTALELAQAASAYFVEAGKLEAGEEDLKHTRALLDRLVQKFPTSDEAVLVMLLEPVGEIDIAALDKRLSQHALEALDAVAPATTRAEASDVAQETAPSLSRNAGESTENTDAPAVTDAPSKPMTSIMTARTAATPQERLRDAIALCYGGEPGMDHTRQATVSFTLDKSGRLTSLPDWAGTASPSADARRLMLSAMLALEDCAPFDLEHGGKSYKGVFGPFEVLQLSFANAPKPQMQASVTPSESQSRDPNESFTTASKPTPRIPAPRVWQAATAETEKALKLTRADKAEVQARLEAMKFDPNGVDGVFGKGTRAAIRKWQLTSRIPETGYLNGPQLTELRTQGQNAFTWWKGVPKNAAKLEKASRKRQRVRVRVKVCTPTLGGLAHWCRYEWQYRYK